LSKKPRKVKGKIPSYTMWTTPIFTVDKDVDEMWRCVKLREYTKSKIE
jgi:hypothetical protein